MSEQQYTHLGVPMEPWDPNETEEPDACAWCGRVACEDRSACEAALEWELSQEMACPAAGGIPCGSKACRTYGCEDQR